MTVKITLTIAEGDTGPFDLYSNLDDYQTPFALDIPKSTLMAGYISAVVPDYTTTIRVQCVGFCTNYIDIDCTTLVYGYSLFYEQTCELACVGYDTTRRTKFFNLL